MTEALVGLHGFAGSPSTFAPLGEFALCPWLSGHGPHPNLEANTFDEELERLARLVAEVPAPRKLVGYSQGARVGLGLLVRYPDLFSSAVLFGVNPGLRKEPDRRARERFEEGFCRLLENHGMEAFVREWERLPIFASQLDWSLKALVEQREIRLSHTPTGLVHALRVLGLAHMPSYWETAGRVTARVHLVTGERDEKFIALHEQLHRIVSNSTLEVLPGVGHNPLVEARARVRFLLLPDS